MTELGRFAEGFSSWRRMLDAVPPESRIGVFANAAHEVASYVSHGLDRIVAIDELADIAMAYEVADADAVQGIIAKQFEDVPPRGNGHAEEFDEAPVEDKPIGPTIEPLHYEDLAAALVAREWLVDDRIPMLNVTLLSGEGAIGKSIALLQLAAAVVLGRDWFGTLPKFGPVLYIAAEEDGDEIRRRLEDIALFFQSSRQELINNGLKVISFAGKSALLAAPDRHELIQPTPLFERIKADAIALRPKLIVIDPVADVFGGKENDRGQTRMFCTLMRGLAIVAGAAVILSSHPSVAGVANDSGLSGSTAWHNSVRARMYFKAVKDSNDKTLRVLEIKKNNYGPVTATIRVHWRMGVYVRPERLSDYEEANINKRADEMFLNLLRDFNQQGRGNVSDKLGPTYAPAKFAKAQDAVDAKIYSQALAEAMERLFKAKRIRSIEEGPKSKRRSRIIEISNHPSNRQNEASNPGPTASNPNVDDMTNWEDDPRNDPFQPENSNQKFFNHSGGAPTPPDPLPGRTDGPGSGRPDSSAATGDRARESVGNQNRLEGAPNPFRVIADCSAETVCMRCGETGNVKRIADSRLVGGKSETLHVHCAEAWFKKIRNQS